MAKAFPLGCGWQFCVPQQRTVFAERSLGTCWRLLSGLSGPPASFPESCTHPEGGCVLYCLLDTTKGCFTFPYEFKTHFSCCTYFRKVANKVTALDIILGQNIKKKWLHDHNRVFVKKQLCQETQVLTINGTHIPINLEENRQNGQLGVSLILE